MMVRDSVIKNVEWRGKIAVVKAEGEIDLNTSSVFQQDLLKVSDESPQRIVIDLSDVDYMDSSGIASLVKLLSHSRKEGFGMVLVSPQKRVQSVLEITRLSTIFDIRDSVDEAME